ncbi:MAG: uroporphyrinogen-III synthase [Flavobacteriales bacterium]
MKKSLFISGMLQPDLRKALFSQGFQITELPMIRTEAIAFDPKIPECEWIFFSSKNAVQYFYAANPITQDQKLAAIGKATARAVRKFGPCDFCGETNDIGSVASEFVKQIGNARVLFPQSSQSLRSVQTLLNASQVIDLNCYHSVPNSSKIDFHTICIFTSPSNTTAYFEKNEIVSDQKVIAFGQSTANALMERGVKDVIIPGSLETKTLLDTILRSSIS